MVSVFMFWRVIDLVLNVNINLPNHHTERKMEDSWSFPFTH